MFMCQATFGLRLRSRPLAQNCEARAYGRTTPRDARPLRRLASRDVAKAEKDAHMACFVGYASKEAYAH